jgi:hypothetical protein
VTVVFNVDECTVVVYFSIILLKMKSKGLVRKVSYSDCEG